jgi:tellurite resistance protein TehA-like permease
MEKEFPWGKATAYFLWILGLAVILADIGYHDFLVHQKRRKRREIFTSDSFLRPVHIAGILILAGLAGSLRTPFLAGLMAAGAFLLIMLIGKDRKLVRMVQRWKRRWPNR